MIIFRAIPVLLLAPLIGAGEGYFPPERPAGIGMGRPGLKDISGRSIKTPRVRAIHTTDSSKEGGTAYLLKVDPWLGYQRGRELFMREFTVDEGAFGGRGKAPGPLLDDGTTPVLTGSHVSGCMICHNNPFRNGGAGPTIFKNAGTGRNTPHLFGAGLIEMLGWQLRLQLLDIGDTNRNGFIDIGESSSTAAIISNLSQQIGGDKYAINFGTFDDSNQDGVPDLNPVCYIWYVDTQGRRLPQARKLTDPHVAGYNFEIQVFGWGHSNQAIRPIPMISTLRGLSAGAFHLHSGLQPYDPTLNEEPKEDGLALVSLAGAQQFFTAKTADRGTTKNANGISIDDPDQDGIPEELTEGDMDLIEFFQLNHPAPAEIFRDQRRSRGRALMTKLNCVRCHVPDWELKPQAHDSRDYTRCYPGDRRFFDLELRANPDSNGFAAKLQDLRTDKSGDSGQLRRSGYVIKGVYSDFAYHDLGPGFHEIQFDGTVVKMFRTAPLWGIGSSAPYGHDGASLDIDTVIRRHSGEAKAESESYAALTPDDRDALLAFLRGLVLYSVDDVPCDINGDSTISMQFKVAGQDTGVERLNPEWLFRTPGEIEGQTNAPNRKVIKSWALRNLDAAYGISLEYLSDQDHDGFPDIRQKAAK